MMFHVERTVGTYVNKAMAILLCSSFVLLACNASRQTVQIPDYTLYPNGKEILGNKALTAFIFENNQAGLPIEQFLSAKFKTDNYSQKEYWVTIDKDKYKIMIYDYSEFEKYFNSANFSQMNALPENAQKGDSRKFIAISMINAYNEDCLAEQSLFQNTAVRYLKALKDEFYHQ